jgi:hypothetical protein
MRCRTIFGWLGSIALALTLVNDTHAARRPRKRSVHEQRIFSEQYPIEKPVALSPAVLKILMGTREVRGGFDFASAGVPRDPAQLFRAAEVHLTGSRKADLIVAGVGPMRGADNDWYWVVRSPHAHPRVVLFAGCLLFEVTRSKTNGYRNIHTFWASAGVESEQTYYFDGVTYRLWKESNRTHN